MFTLNGHDVYVGTGIGIAVSASRSLEAEQLIREADIALYCVRLAVTATLFF